MRLISVPGCYVGQDVCRIRHGLFSQRYETKGLFCKILQKVGMFYAKSFETWAHLSRNLLKQKDVLHMFNFGEKKIDLRLHIWCSILGKLSFMIFDIELLWRLTKDESRYRCHNRKMKNAWAWVMMNRGLQTIKALQFKNYDFTHSISNSKTWFCFICLINLRACYHFKVSSYIIASFFSFFFFNTCE